MNERIRELALSKGIYDCLCDPYDKFKTGDNYGSVMWDLERFAELIIREVFIKIEDERYEVYEPVKEAVMKYFGVEE